ncbi:MAG TPA: hypothetical protein VKD72_27615, partial [Gemmataceae bacterium]|nr:hypothetical protein [Gemmataceae bacterium]
MSHHPLSAPALLFCCFLILPSSAAADEFQVLLEKNYRLNLPARKPDEKELTQDTRIVSVDVFLDRKAGRLFYVGKAGNALAVVPSGKGIGETDGKALKPVHRLVLPVRRFHDKDFGEKTPKISVEVYRDKRTANWVFVSHTGALAVFPADKAPVGKPGQKARWLYRLPLKVRHLDKFEVEYHLCNVDVYRDEYTGALLYVAESGTLAAIPRGKSDPGQNADAQVWSHALELKVRKPGAEKFEPITSTRFGMEIYQDRNRGAWVHVTEKLQLAVVPGSKALGEKIQAPVWLQGLRPPGDPARQWSAEVYDNPNVD